MRRLQSALRCILLILPAAFLLPTIEAATIGFITMQKAAAGSTTIGGRRLSCRAARVRYTNSLPVVGAASAGTIFLNRRLLRKYPSVTRRLIFLHECGHQYVGSSEIGADCWAVKAAKRQGWLTERGVRTVCRSFYKARRTATHPAGPARCSAMLSCYRSATGPRRSRATRKKRRRAR